jgi:hypothetical protein
MKVLTIDTYFNVLEKCTLEAFESLKTKDYYPNDGTKAIWDVSSLKIEKTDGLLTESDKELFKKEYIKENLSITFLLALERNSEKFKKKYSIQRETFYKKCYESLLFKTTQSELWRKPDFGFNIDKPCVLTFLNYNKIHFIQRSKEQKTEPEAIDLNKESKSITKNQNNVFDPNNFNNECYNLFYYLVDNYKKKGKIKFINIYYYLKDEVKKDKYSFNFIQSDYTEFIKRNYKIEIKKYQKATFDFDEQKRVLNSLEEQFRK